MGYTVGRTKCTYVTLGVVAYLDRRAISDSIWANHCSSGKRASLYPCACQWPLCKVVYIVYSLLC